MPIVGGCVRSHQAAVPNAGPNCKKLSTFWSDDQGEPVYSVLVCCTGPVFRPAVLHFVHEKEETGRLYTLQPRREEISCGRQRLFQM